MSIGNEVDRLRSAKTALRAAIEEKGVSVPESSTIDSYAEYVAAIPNGVTSVNGQTGDVEIKVSTVSVTLLASGWTGDAAPYLYKAAIQGVTTTSVQDWYDDPDMTLEQLDAWQDARVVNGGQSANTVIFKAWGDKPTVDIPLRCILRKDL